MGNGFGVAAFTCNGFLKGRATHGLPLPETSLLSDSMAISLAYWVNDIPNLL